MTQKDKSAARDRILSTALSLFARRGFAAVGVREIAAQAEVNISMISYYYNGKTGILVALMESFMDQTYDIIQATSHRDLPADQKLCALIEDLVDFVKDNFALTEVVFHAMPLDIPEIAERKSAHIHRIFDVYDQLAKGLGLKPNDVPLFVSIGPAMISMILTHFRFKNIQSQIFGLNFDSDFYIRYKKIITTLMLDGMHGLADLPDTVKESRL